MKVDRRVLFIICLIIGNIAMGSSIFFYYDKDSTFESVAVFTSLATAIYAILAEPKAKTEPLLRITPTLKSYPIAFIGNSRMGGSTDLNVWIENIGYSIAKDIEIRCQLIPEASIPLKDSGVYKYSLLAPREKVQYQVVEAADDERLLSQQLIIEVSYSNEDNKKQKPIKKGYPIRELKQGLTEVKT